MNGWMLQNVCSFDELNVILVQYHWSGHQTLKVQTVRKVFERRRTLADGMVTLRFRQLAVVTAEAVVQTKRQRCHFLGDYHERSGYVDGWRRIIVVHAMHVHTGQIQEGDHQDQAKIEEKKIN